MLSLREMARPGWLLVVLPRSVGRALCKTSNDNEYRLQCRIRITSLHIFFAALLLFTLLLVITRDQSVIALNREYFPGRAHGGFLLPHHDNPAMAPPGAAPAVLRDGCEGAGQGLRRLASQRRCSRSGGALPRGCGSVPGFLPTQAQTISQAIGWLPFPSLTNTATRTSPLSCCRICSICPASSVAMAVRSPWARFEIVDLHGLDQRQLVVRYVHSDQGSRWPTRRARPSLRHGYLLCGSAPVDGSSG